MKCNNFAHRQQAKALRAAQLRDEVQEVAAAWARVAAGVASAVNCTRPEEAISWADKILAARAERVIALKKEIAQ